MYAKTYILDCKISGCGLRSLSASTCVALTSSGGKNSNHVYAMNIKRQLLKTTFSQQIIVMSKYLKFGSNMKLTLYVTTPFSKSESLGNL